jgi:sodium/hydrogen antiporter
MPGTGAAAAGTDSGEPDAGALPPAPPGAMHFSWFLLAGFVLILMAFASRWVSRMPLSFSLIYLVTGFLISPFGLGLVDVELVRDAATVELLAEIAVLISLFVVGLRLRQPLMWHAWRTPLKLATLTMILTIAGVAGAAHILLALPWPVAILLGAVLAPTDPVLASDVQVQRPGERDALRVALTAEAGLNDGTAFPAVLLGLMLIGGRPDFAAWFALDIAWAVAAALALGAGCGMVLAIAVNRLRRSGVPLEFEEFLALGLIAASYGIALAIHAYGFVAVFVAGLAFAHVERRGADPIDRAVSAAGAETANRLLAFSTRCERLAEVVVVLLIGVLLWDVDWSIAILLFAALLIVLIRPLATALTIRHAELSAARRRALGWFGIRGIGSIYYVAYAFERATYAPWMHDVASATLATVAISIGVHGVSATPLMRRLRVGRNSSPASDPSDSSR